MSIQRFQDLRVWQAGMDLAEENHLLTATFPDRELYGITSQLRRTAAEMPSNVAQGHTLETTQDYLRHLSRAHGFLAQLQTYILLADRFAYFEEDQVTALMEKTVSLAKQMYSLRNALTRNL